MQILRTSVSRDGKLVSAQTTSSSMEYVSISLGRGSNDRRDDCRVRRFDGIPSTREIFVFLRCPATITRNPIETRSTCRVRALAVRKHRRGASAHNVSTAFGSAALARRRRPRANPHTSHLTHTASVCATVVRRPATVPGVVEWHSRYTCAQPLCETRAGPALCADGNKIPGLPSAR